jgi:hypothetical protein
LPDAEWGAPPDHKDALPEPPEAAGWEWELDANGVPVRNLPPAAADLREGPPLLAESRTGRSGCLGR